MAELIGQGARLDYTPHEGGRWALGNPGELADRIIAAETVVAWRYRNERGGITSEWIDGPVPVDVRDAIATSGLKIDVAYASPA